MPNTKSAARRMRSSERRRLRNCAVKARLRRLEKKYLAAVLKGDRENATLAFREVSSALDKAAKTGVLPRGKADRKKSRLSRRLNQIK
jgi:small subunit ribosomal protein S20